jgi:hypothetical protein
MKDAERKLVTSITADCAKAIIQILGKKAHIHLSRQKRKELSDMLWFAVAIALEV